MLLYNLLLILASPLWVPWMLWRTFRRSAKPDWRERLGLYPLSPRGKPRVWVHAVSVGEVVAVMPILREIRQALPGHEIVLSVTTSSGHSTARDKAQGLFDHLVYLPVDVLPCVWAALGRVRPAVVAMMETELWPNLLWAAKRFGARTVVINGRISDRSFPRARRLGFLYRAVLRSVDRCLMQAHTDADRIRVLGAPQPEVLGNCKFDQAQDGLDADPAAWREALGLEPGKPVVVVGSTRGEEEERFVLEALATVGFGKIRVIHAPRHLERVPALAEAVRAAAGSVALRSRQETGPYLLLDTYGELTQVYAVADVVVVGGGFAPLGGQNILQPLAHGKPVLHGPHMANFRDVAQMAADAGATTVCATPEALARELARLLDDPAARQSQGEAAALLVRANVGASRRYAEAIAAEAGKVASHP